MREGSKPDGRDAARLGPREPGAALAARASKNSRKLDFFPCLCLRVINSDVKHGKALLELFRTRLGSVPGRKLGFQPAVNFEGVTEAGSPGAAATILILRLADRRRLLSVSRSSHASESSSRRQLFMVLPTTDGA
jgi:hypothetical protein